MHRYAPLQDLVDAGVCSRYAFRVGSAAIREGWKPRAYFIQEFDGRGPRPWFIDKSAKGQNHETRTKEGRA